MENNYEFMNPINYGIKMVVQMTANHDREVNREKDLLDLVNLLEQKILELKAIYLEIKLLETWYSICSIAKLIAQVECSHCKISDFDFQKIQNHLEEIEQNGKEYYIPIVTAFYRYCKRNALYETAKILCLLVRIFSENSIEESKEYLPILLENEFSLVLNILMFWTSVKLHESPLNLEIQDCDRKLSEILGSRINPNNGYEITACPSYILNYDDADKLSKSLFQMFDKVQKESVLDLDKSTQLLDTSKIFLGLEKTEDKFAFVRGLSCKLLATFCEEINIKCKLYRESSDNFVKISSSDRDVL